MHMYQSFISISKELFVLAGLVNVHEMGLELSRNVRTTGCIFSLYLFALTTIFNRVSVHIDYISSLIV